MNAIVITTTADNQELLTQIAERLLQDRLAACCQVLGPLTSIYRWKDKVEKASEWMCLIKTRKEHFERVAAVIGELHSYEVPEIIATEMHQASSEYLAWLFEETDV
jgi:periplasmic divalent cation tolerance protein